jgi:cytochrome c oxidase subunit 5a
MKTSLLSNVLRASSRTTVARAALPRSGSVASALTAQRYASTHAEESFEAFSDRYVSFFQNAEDLFEVQRGLNNCFAHDLVPSPQVVDAALRAARRVNDYATAVRIFDGVREKVENKKQYEAYLEELKPVREELGIDTVEELYGSS